MTRPSCLLADDHPALCEAISAFLEADGFRVVGPVGDGVRAVEAAAAGHPELALLDYRMPELEGAALVRALLAASPATRVVVYTADGDQHLAAEATAAGASGVVLKESSLTDLRLALQEVRAGGTYLDPNLSEPAPPPLLTERERAVLELLTHGLGHEEVGRRLGISAETVRTHVRKACERLGASTRTQAVATALRLGLIA